MINLNDILSIQGDLIPEYEYYRYKRLTNLIIDFWINLKKNILDKNIKDQIYLLFSNEFNKTSYLSILKNDIPFQIQVHTLNDIIEHKIYNLHKIINLNSHIIYSKKSIDDFISKIIFFITTYVKLKKIK